MWSDIVQKTEETLTGEKGREKDNQDQRETLSRLHLAMTQRLAQREGIDLADGIDLCSRSTDKMELEEKNDGEEGAGDIEREKVEERERKKAKKKREWKERAGAGMSAGKGQRLA